jgi:hypothetical protein
LKPSKTSAKTSGSAIVKFVMARACPGISEVPHVALIGEEWWMPEFFLNT